MLGITKIILGKVIDTVDLSTTACKRKTLSISLFASTDTDDFVPSKDLKGWWVNTFLIDDDEVLISTVAKFSLQSYDLHNFVIGELSLGGNELLPLFSV